MNDFMNGVMMCARYAFAPNFYHYCGPDTGGEFGEYLKKEVSDGGLVEHLSKFEVMYPYLAAIAQANGIADPLDERVVEAYWVGNSLLDKVRERDVYEALVGKQQLGKRLSKNEMKWLLPKIDAQARLHHSFHVLHVFTRTGHHALEHTVETMDSCRISWGKVAQNSKLKTNSHNLKLKTQQLEYSNGELRLIPATKTVVVMADELNNRIKTGDWVSVHWGFVCDRLSEAQVQRLKKYTDHHVSLANRTI